MIDFNKFAEQLQKSKEILEQKNKEILEERRKKMEQPAKCLDCDEYLKDMNIVRQRTHLYVLGHRIEGGLI